MAEQTDSQPKFGSERAKMIVKELADAVQSAALSLVDEQKARAAAQVSHFAEALEAAGRSFEQSQSPVAAEYLCSAARQVGELVEALRRRRWTAIVADLEDIARHQPIQFIAGAAVLGFLVGRLVTAAPTAAAERSNLDSSRPAEGTVTAAVASGSGKLSDATLASEAREVP
jgi:hypothetical protein